LAPNRLAFTLWIKQNRAFVSGSNYVLTELFQKPAGINLAWQAWLKACRNTLGFILAANAKK
jgi:hypothetical protein